MKIGELLVGTLRFTMIVLILASLMTGIVLSLTLF